MAYKVFTNGSPLPASDLNTYLMNQSVISFANATARDATLTSPTEGMVVYLEDTNALYLYTGSAWVIQNPITTEGDLIVGGASGVPGRLGIGTNGQVLQSDGTTASWVTPTSGGLAEISSTSLSGSSVSLTSISGSFKGLLLFLRNYNFAADSVATLQFNSDTGSNYFTINSNSTTSSTSSGTSFSTTFSNHKVSEGAIANAVIELPFYANSGSLKTIRSWTATANTGTAANRNINLYYGCWADSSAITSIQINTASTFNAGTAILYGVN